MLSDYPSVLKLVKGSSQPFEIHLFGNDEGVEDLTGVTRVIVTIKEAPGEIVLLILDSDVGSEVTIGSGVLTCQPSSALDLDAGTYLLDVALEKTEWYITRPIEVNVIEPLTVTP